MRWVLLACSVSIVVACGSSDNTGSPGDGGGDGTTTGDGAGSSGGHDGGSGSGSSSGGGDAAAGASVVRYHQPIHPDRAFPEPLVTADRPAAPPLHTPWPEPYTPPPLNSPPSPCNCV